MELTVRTCGAVSDVLEIITQRHQDDRGFFSETYNREAFRRAGINYDFLQDNHSFSHLSGTVRGLHFQSPPFAQVKLVRVTKGAIYDVAVDIRVGSPTFGRHVGVSLSSDKGNQLLIPIGFAHGFCTLESDTEVLYKVDAPYSKNHDLGLLWSDPELAIDWPTGPQAAVLSNKDKNHPRLGELEPYFLYSPDA